MYLFCTFWVVLNLECYYLFKFDVFLRSMSKFFMVLFRLHVLKLKKNELLKGSLWSLHEKEGMNRNE